jgi:hypothetical protein
MLRLNLHESWLTSTNGNRQCMTDVIPEGDWVGDRFKFYAQHIRKAILYDPSNNSVGRSSAGLVHRSVILAWAAYASSFTLFPNLLIAGVSLDGGFQESDLDAVAVLNLTKCILTVPLARVEITIPA